MKKKKYSRVYQRHQARRLCVQALYEWLVNAQDGQIILDRLLSEQSTQGVDKAYLEQCFLGVTQKVDDIQALIGQALDRALPSLTPVESAVLHLAVYELTQCIDVPYKIVINEAIKLTKEFGAPEGYKYINGVLDKLALELRKLER